MPFGQSPGPPASRRQVETLAELVRAAGHADFRDARGPLGLNQRQAGGRFTRDEAEELIARLEAGAAAGEPVETTPRAGAPMPHRSPLAGIADDVLAAELQRRGWIVVEPD